MHDYWKAPAARLWRQLTGSFLVALLVLSTGSGSYVAGQTAGDSSTQLQQQPQARLGGLRQERDRLRQTLRDQQTRSQQLLEEEKSLLSQQAQLQQRIGQVERELKLPQLPAEYQTKKCKLEEMVTKQQGIQKQISERQQQTNQVQQQITQLQARLGQTQMQISQTQQQISQAEQQAQQDAQNRADQQAQQQAGDPMAARMTGAADPLIGLPIPIGEALAVPGAPGTTEPPLTLFASVPAGGFFIGLGLPGPASGTPLTLGTPVTQADANSAKKIVLTLNVIINTVSTPVIVGLGNNAGGLFFNAGAPDIVGRTGILVFELTPGQFTAAVDGLSWRATGPGTLLSREGESREWISIGSELIDQARGTVIRSFRLYREVERG